MKLYICGYGAKNRSASNPESTGKDVAASIIREETGLTFESSSWFACRHFIYDQLKDRYGSIEECYKDRHNNRSLWFDLIADYNTPDPAALSKAVFVDNDIYVGIRKIEEFRAAYEQGVVDLSLWIDASRRVEPEDSTSCTITADDCDLIIRNNGTLEQFEIKVKRFCKLLKDHLSKQKAIKRLDKFNMCYNFGWL